MAVYEAEERETVLLFDGIKKVWTIQTNVLSHMNGFKDKIKPETLKQEIDEDTGRVVFISGQIDDENFNVNINKRAKRPMTDEEKKKFSERMNGSK